MFERLFWNKMKGLPNRSRFGDRVEYLFWFAKEKGFKFNIDEMRTEYSEKSIQRMKKPLKKSQQNDLKKKEFRFHQECRVKDSNMGYISNISLQTCKSALNTKIRPKYSVKNAI